MRIKNFLCLLPLIFFVLTTSYLSIADAASRAGRPKHAQSSLSDYHRSGFNLYSVQDDIQIGKQVMDLQIREFKKKNIGVDLPKDQALKKRIEKIVKRIAMVSDRPDLPFEVHVFNKPDIANAFSLPGGKIGVFTGLFDKEKGLVDINNDDQIAAVLAHEIAHATLRHVTRQVSKLQGWGLLGNIASVAIGSGVGTEFQRVFNQVFVLGANLYLPTYTRKFERQADQAGFYTMSKAKFKPEAALSIWRRALTRGGPNSGSSSFLATHPSSAERVQNLQAWLPEAQLIAGETKNK